MVNMLLLRKNVSRRIHKMFLSSRSSNYINWKCVMMMLTAHSQWFISCIKYNIYKENNVYSGLIPYNLHPQHDVSSIHTNIMLLSNRPETSKYFTVRLTTKGSISLAYLKSHTRTCHLQITLIRHFLLKHIL